MPDNIIVRYETARGSITFDQRSMQFWISNFDSASGLQIEMRDTRSVGEIGATLSNKVVGARSLTVDGYIFEPVAENRRKLLDIVAPKVPGRFTLIDGEQAWYLDVVPEHTPEFDDNPNIQGFQMRLYAQFPYWQTTQRAMRQLALITGRFRFPFHTGGTWRLSDYTEGYFSDIANYGNVEIAPVVTFFARQGVVNPELLHMDSGKRIRIEKTMLAGERIIVDTRHGQRSATLLHPNGDRQNGFRFLSLDSDLSLALLPGANRLRFDADLHRSNLNVYIDAPRGIKSGV
ncbi:MAG: phage tail family protein [Oscillospiraceae bacterium]|nr:phage tail family protein [Oscillospiraceae bacterium]